MSSQEWEISSLGQKEEADEERWEKGMEVRETTINFNGQNRKRIQSKSIDVGKET